MSGVNKKVAGSGSWILMDSSGLEVVLAVDKYTTMDRMKIHARDLRIIGPLLSYPSTILVREKAIVLNLEHIKAIITAEEVLLHNPLDENVVLIVEELRRRLKPLNMNSEGDNIVVDNSAEQDDDETAEEDDSPFEFRALEVALEAICSYLSARTIELECAVYPSLDMLTMKITSRNLDRVRKLKSQLTRLTARVQKVKDELEQLLDDDDDMVDFYLSRKLAEASPMSGFHGSPIASRIPKISKAASFAIVRAKENDVDELALLLESYFMQIDRSLNKLLTVDKYRNRLIQLELFLSSANMTLAVYSLLTGIFGMNFPFTWNKHHGYMFKWVCIVTGFASIIVFILIIGSAHRKGLLF